MSFFKNASIKSRLVTVAGLCLTAVAFCVAVGFWSSERLGELSQRVFVSKDVVADILPPPMYLIEMRLVLSRLFEKSLEPAAAHKEVERLAKEYQDRVIYWKANPPYGLEKYLLGVQDDAGQKFIADALRVSTKASSMGVDSLRDELPKLQVLYEAHRAGVDETVSQGNTFAAAEAEGFASVASATRTTLLATLILVVGLLSFIFRRIISSVTRPITQMQVMMTGIATSQDFSRRVPVERMDEIGMSIVAFNAMIGKIQESSQQLKQKTADIQAMMHYIPQGILTVMAGNKVHPEFSAYLETILETKDIAGRDLMELVFADSNFNAEILSQVEAAVSASIGEDAMNFEFNEHLLVSEVEKKMLNGQVKILSLNWSPITDDADTVVSLMLCVRDVTELKSLAAEAGHQKRELDIIGQILAISQEKFGGFIDGSVEFLAENKKIIEVVGATPGGALDPETVTQLFRNMHTVKGNARTYGLLHLTNMVHEAERTYDELRKNPDAVWDQEKLLSELAHASAAIEEYAHINKVKLGRTGPGRRAGVEKYLMVLKVDIQDALDFMDDAVRGNDPAQLRAAYQRVQKMLEMLGTVRMKDALEAVVESLPSLAKELAKEPPEVTIDDRSIVLRTQIADLLKNVFMHLYRNAMDHGIESPSARVAKGKKPAGHIRLELSLVADRFLLTLRDDGRGLAVEHIKQKALQNGLITAGQELSAQEIAQLIFLRGFSTADKVTEVSGRGVGMDAVQSFVKSAEGSIELKLLSTLVDGYCPFETVISLPANLAVQGDVTGKA